jgi:hypothetical protein
MSTSITKDALADLTLQELLIRIIQTQTAKAINGAFQTQILQLLKLEYIRNNIRENISLKNLRIKLV